MVAAIVCSCVQSQPLLLIITGKIVSLINSILNTALVLSGTGRHLDTLIPSEISSLAKFLFAALPVNVLALTLAKLSVTCFLLRLHLNKSLRIGVHCLQVLIVITLIATYVIRFLGCQPLEVYWDPTISGHCWSPYVGLWTLYLVTVLAALTDWISVLIPIFYIRKVYIERRIKCCIWLLTSLGILLVLQF